MRIAITSSGPTLDSQIDPRFGRARYVLIVDIDRLGVEAIENPNVTAGGGAGVQTSQMVISRSVEAVLTGNCGPNAYRTLNAANVQVYAGVSGTVRAAVETFRRGELSPLSGPSVPGHSGTGRDSDGDARGAT